MGQLTTHVLDMGADLPPSGVRIKRLLATTATGPDGRVSVPMPSDANFKVGSYLLTFHTAAYFRARGVQLPQPAFIEEAGIRIGMAAADEHYHVPLLIAPWGYSVYRGG